MTSSAKTTRWLDLLAFLLNRGFPVTREEIFQHVAGYLHPAEARPGSPLSAYAERGTGGEGDAGTRERGDAQAESARRKFERDKDELRELGLEIETVALRQDAPDDPNAGYRLRVRDFYLPYFELTGDTPAQPYRGLRSVALTDDEVRILDQATARLAVRDTSPLVAGARSLRRKLAFDLPLTAGAAPRLLAAALNDAEESVLRLLQDAVARRRVVRCTYHSMGRDAVEHRVIEPYGLFFTWGQWYCVAQARDRDALRVFRLERMHQAELLKEPFTVPDAFTIRDYLGRRPWELSEREPARATVRFAFPEARWVLARQVGETVDDTLDDGGAVIAFAVRDANPFLRWLLTFGPRADLLEPEGLRDQLTALRQKVAAIYEGDT